jgi:hypothetical protein
MDHSVPPVEAPDPFGLVVFVAVFALVPVQAAANTVNAAVAPAHDRSSRFTAWNWVTIVLGGLLFLLSLVGSFLPHR